MGPEALREKKTLKSVICLSGGYNWKREGFDIIGIYAIFIHVSTFVISLLF